MARRQVSPPGGELPEYLEKFPWQEWHFYQGKGSNPKKALNKIFIDEAMRFYEMTYKIDEYQIVPLPSKKEPIVAMKVTVTRDEYEYQGFATVGDKTYEEGQSHFGQIVLGRALKVAVKRALKISDHDVEIIIAKKLGGGKNIRVVEDTEMDEPKQVTETVEAPKIKDEDFFKK